MAAIAVQISSPSNLLRRFRLNFICAVARRRKTHLIALAIVWDTPRHRVHPVQLDTVMYFVVGVRHNLVEQIRCCDDLIKQQIILKSNLDAGSLLAENFQTNGCIDGEYCFDDAERAKIFASVCMDFTKKLLQSRLERIDNLNSGEEFVA